MFAGSGQVLGVVVDADPTEASLEGLQPGVQLRGDLDGGLGQPADQQQLGGPDLLGQLHLGGGLLVGAPDFYRHGHLPVHTPDGDPVPFAVVQLGGQLEFVPPTTAHHQDQLAVLEEEGHIVLGLLLAAGGKVDHSVGIERPEVEAQPEVALPEVAIR